VNIKILAI